MTRTPKTPADVSPVRVAQAKPGGPSPVPPEAGEGGQMSAPQSRERAVVQMPAPVRGRAPRTPAGGVGASPASSAGSTALAAAKMSEDRGPDSLDAHVRRYLKDLDLMGYHTKDSRRSGKGFPDWTIAGIGGLIFRELKTQRGRCTPEQAAWLGVLEVAGADVAVWRPEDLFSGRIANELVAVAGLRAATG